MKKIAIISLLSLCAAGAYAQGTLIFTDSLAGDNAQIYSPNTANPGVSTKGNTSAQLPAGTQSYPSANFTPIGGSTGTGLNYAYGNQFTVQVYWMPGTVNTTYVNATSTHLASVYATLLTPKAAYSGQDVSGNDIGQGLGNPSPSYIGTLATTSNPGAGFLQSGSQDQSGGLFGTQQTLDDWNNDGAADYSAVVALACWYNAGNTINSLSAASIAGVPYGISLPVQFGVNGLNQLAESGAIESLYAGKTEPAGTPNAPLWTSFSLVGGTVSIPEPSTIALGVLGVCAFLARRRK